MIYWQCFGRVRFVEGNSFFHLVSTRSYFRQLAVFCSGSLARIVTVGVPELVTLLVQYFIFNFGRTTVKNFRMNLTTFF